MGQKPARTNDAGEREDDGPDRSVERTRDRKDADALGDGYVEYERGPDPRALSERYGMDVRGAEAGKLQRLEREFGRDRVQRWAEEGMSVETMGKPREMRAFRAGESAGPGVTAGVGSGGGTAVQPKLEVSSPDDPAEKEAEEVARAVTERDDEGAMETGADSDATAAARGAGSDNAGRAEAGLDGPGTEAGVGTALSEVEALDDDGPLDAKLGASSQGGRTGRGAESRGSLSGPAGGSGAVQNPDRSGSPRGSAVESGTDRHIRSMDGRGTPLPPSERSFFESRFGSDFGAVRIHTGDGANELARKLGARAFTLGNHVGFADGEYDPGSAAGRRLIAHELTHTIQQAGNRPVPSAAGESSADDPAEREAEAVADRVMNDEPPGRIQRTSTDLQLRNGRSRNRQRARLRSQVFIRRLNENLNKLKVSEVKIGRVRGTYGGNRSGGRSGGERESSGGGKATGRAQQGPRRPPGERQGRGPGMPGGPGTPSDPVAATAAAFAIITQKEKDPAKARVSTFVEARVFLYHVAKRRSASIPATVYTVYEMRPGAPIVAVALEGSKDRARQLVKDLNGDEELDSTFAMRESPELSKKFREFQTKVFTDPSMTE